MFPEQQLSSSPTNARVVMESVNSAAVVESFWVKLAQLDLGAIAHSLQRTKGWNRQRTLRAIVGYLAFLLMVYLYPGQKLVPSEEVDAVWHCHILDTLKYTEDCQNLFGYYVHHFPYFGERDEADQQDLQQSFVETEQFLSHALTMMVNTSLQAQSCPPQASGCCLKNANLKLVRPGSYLTLEKLLNQSEVG